MKPQTADLGGIDRIIFNLPIGLVAFFTFTAFYPPLKDFNHWLLAEDHPVEWLQFFAFLLTGVLGLKLALLIKSREGLSLNFWFYLLVACGAFLVAMEEVSWGQWIFGFKSPEYFERVNQQEEVNLHNMPILHGIFELARAFFGVAGLYAIRFSKNPKLKYFAAVPALSSWFFYIALIGGLDLLNHNIMPTHNIVLRWAYELVEPLELLVAVVVLLYVWFNLKLFQQQTANKTI